MSNDWTPFRPEPEDLERIAGEVAAIPKIQAELLANHPDLKAADRGAHQYQVAGSRVELRIDDALPAALDGIGLFEPGAMPSRHRAALRPGSATRIWRPTPISSG